MSEKVELIKKVDKLFDDLNLEDKTRVELCQIMVNIYEDNEYPDDLDFEEDQDDEDLEEDKDEEQEFDTDSNEKMEDVDDDNERVNFVDTDDILDDEIFPAVTEKNTKNESKLEKKKLFKRPLIKKPRIDVE